MSTLLWLDYGGVFVFALSGALMAARNRMDVFGYIVMALMPAVGGGTIRDLILGVPVFWIEDNVYLFLTLSAAMITYYGARWIVRLQRALTWMDAVGLSVFCVLGAEKSLTLLGNPVIAVVMGVITAVAGGIIRDVIANHVPMILHKEVYATAAFTGGVVYVLAAPINLDLAVWLAILVAFTMRAGGIIFSITLPNPADLDK